MKKSRIFLILSTLIFCAALALSFTSCNSSKCNHSYTDSVTIEPGCENEGIKTFTCNLCGHSYTETLAAKGHDYTDETCTVCGFVINSAIGLQFKNLTLNGNTAHTVVSNSTEYFSFIDAIVAVGGAKYVVSLDITGTQPIYAKTIELAPGDNTVYIIELINDEPTNIYIATVRRRPMYEVSFNTKGGTSVNSILIEEGFNATAPTTTRAGYTFVSWDYDFSAPITKDTIVTATWQANPNTAYKVEYYLENLNKNGYDLIETDNLAGTTDTTANAEIKNFDHFSHNAKMSVLSGNINGNESLVLKVYYTRNVYTVSINDYSMGSISNAGTHAYRDDFELALNVAELKLGYIFNGWYSGDKLLSTDLEYKTIVDKNIEARFELDSQMSNFNFTSTATTCNITGIKNKKLKEIVVPDYVTSISGGAFSGCSNIESITIGNSVTSIGSGAFYGCDSLTSVTIPNSVTSVGGSAFSSCSSLTSVTIGNSVTSIGKYAFDYCSSLTSVYITDIVAWCNISFGGYYANPLYYAGNLYLNGELVTELVIPEGVTSIGSRAFYGCDSLTSVTIPDSVTSVGGEAFEKCDSLTSVTIGNSVTSIGVEAFYACSSLTSVTIPDSVTSIGSSAFSVCSSLTSVTIGNSVTSIGSSAFYDCDSLTSVTIGNSVTSIGGYAFAYCDSLTSVTIGNSVTSIGDYAFYYCSSLYVVINHSDLLFEIRSTNNGYVAYYAKYLNDYGIITYANDGYEYILTDDGFLFDYDGTTYRLIAYTGGNQTVTLPENINGKSYKIYYISGVVNVIIPDGVTSIGNKAFYNCSSLTSVTIGNSVTSIGNYAFKYCSSLKTINFTGTEEEWNAISKGSDWDSDTGKYEIIYNYKE